MTKYVLYPAERDHARAALIEALWHLQEGDADDSLAMVLVALVKLRSAFAPDDLDKAEQRIIDTIHGIQKARKEARERVVKGKRKGV